MVGPSRGRDRDFSKHLQCRESVPSNFVTRNHTWSWRSGRVEEPSLCPLDFHDWDISAPTKDTVGEGGLREILE